MFGSWRTALDRYEPISDQTEDFGSSTGACDWRPVECVAVGSGGVRGGWAGPGGATGVGTNGGGGRSEGCGRLLAGIPSSGGGT